MPGRWFSTTAGRFLDYESLLERDWMLLMDFDAVGAGDGFADDQRVDR
jgi:hypothetical protein